MTTRYVHFIVRSEDFNKNIPLAVESRIPWPSSADEFLRLHLIPLSQACLAQWHRPTQVTARRVRRGRIQDVSCVFSLSRLTRLCAHQMVRQFKKKTRAKLCSPVFCCVDAISAPQPALNHRCICLTESIKFFHCTRLWDHFITANCRRRARFPSVRFAPETQHPRLQNVNSHFLASGGNRR